MADTIYDYGDYALAGAELLTLPQWTSQGVMSVAVNSAAVAEAMPAPLVNGQKRKAGPIANNAYRPRSAKRRKIAPVMPAPPPVLPPLPPALPPPPPPPPPISGVGVMDVGAGGCQILFDQNIEPVIYFDVGFPLNVFRRSAPPNLWAGAVAPSGPIFQNANGNLEVVLSHWDWDHWRLAHVWPGLNLLPWTYVVQPVGPAAANFIATLAAPNIYGGAAATPTVGGFTMYQCVPPIGAVPAVLMNNSGIAMGVSTRLPIADLVPHDIILTGDANFDVVPALHPLYPNVSGITAAHHGSNNHGAALNLPNPVAPYAVAGRIAYSYGIKQNAAGAWIHCYGFPVPAAVLNYIAAGWGTAVVPPIPILHRSTAEGAALNGPNPPVGRGNIRMGAQTAVPVAYNNTAFAVYPNPLT